jgi:peptidoglycan/xylan/chitin deacetylase (PgdA/CDA1 family)
MTRPSRAFTKYGVHATFNIINTAGHAKPDYVAKVNKLIAEGHEIGDHTVLHNTFMYEQPP